MYNVLECDLTQFGLHGLDCILSARWMTEMLKKEGKKKNFHNNFFFFFFLTGQLIATINQQHQNSNLHLFLMLAFLFP